MNILEGLNEEQIRAVTIPPNESALVLAGAGSGKTSVLTRRIVWLLQKGFAYEKEILAVTFTNKAAKEMRNRVAILLGYEPQNLWIGTFHSLCFKMLRDFGPKIGLPQDLHILDEEDQRAIVKRILKNLREKGDDENVLASDIVYYISARKERRDRSIQISKDKKPIYEKVYDAYIEQCLMEGGFDFSDIINETNMHLGRNAANMRTHYSERFKYILIDEFQDINEIQFQLIKNLRGNKTSFFAVGDDDQAIYSFRGADPSFMRQFLDEMSDGNIIRLELNYRSTANILAAANSIISNNSGRIGKTLRTEKNEGNKIQFCVFRNPKEEAEWIIRHITRMINAGANLNDIAILYRVHQISSPIEKALIQARIPYTLYGGINFLERKEIKDIMAYLRMAIKKHDDTAFERVINFPPRGIGMKTVYKIRKIAEEQKTSLWQAAIQSGEKKLKPFIDFVTEISIAAEELRIDELIEYIIEEGGIKELHKEKEEEFRNFNIDEFVKMAKNFAQGYNANTKAKMVIQDFLASICLEEETSNQDKKEKTVKLMTIHAAKGLEFKYVFLVGAEEGLLPYKKNSQEEKEEEEKDQNIEEERRLMYVAVTRAKNILYITHSKRKRYANKDQNNEYGKESVPISRFCKEIPGDLIKNNDFSFVRLFRSQPNL